MLLESLKCEFSSKDPHLSSLRILTKINIYILQGFTFIFLVYVLQGSTFIFLFRIIHVYLFQGFFKKSTFLSSKDPRLSSSRILRNSHLSQRFFKKVFLLQESFEKSTPISLKDPRAKN